LKWTDEQEYILKEISDKGLRNGVIDMKTGRGKGMVILGLIVHYAVKTLILTHNIDTCEDIYARCREYLSGVSF
jgi:superfamily II DNA or RNA helicase